MRRPRPAGPHSFIRHLRHHADQEDQTYDHKDDDDGPDDQVGESRGEREEEPSLCVEAQELPQGR